MPVIQSLYILSKSAEDHVLANNPCPETGNHSRKDSEEYHVIDVRHSFEFKLLIKKGDIHHLGKYSPICFCQ